MRGKTHPTEVLAIVRRSLDRSVVAFSAHELVQFLQPLPEFPNRVTDLVLRTTVLLGLLVRHLHTQLQRVPLLRRYVTSYASDVMMQILSRACRRLLLDRFCSVPKILNEKIQIVY